MHTMHYVCIIYPVCVTVHNKNKNDGFKDPTLYFPTVSVLFIWKVWIAILRSSQRKGKGQHLKGAIMKANCAKSVKEIEDSDSFVLVCVFACVCVWLRRWWSMKWWADDEKTPEKMSRSHRKTTEKQGENRYTKRLRVKAKEGEEKKTHSSSSPLKQNFR